MSQRKKRWILYVLACGGGSLYTGITNNLPRRLKAHRSGRGARYTRAHPPRKVLLQWRVATRPEALRREAWFKKKTAVQKRRLLELPLHALERRYREEKKGAL